MTAKILTVDDSRTIRMIIQRALRPYDCAICEAADGEEGLEVAERERPHLIILDVTMPVMDGMAMLTALRKNSDLRNIPVIMLSAENGRDTVAQIEGLGIADYLVKPFKDEQIAMKVNGVLRLQPNPATAD